MSAGLEFGFQSPLPQTLNVDSHFSVHAHDEINTQTEVLWGGGMISEYPKEPEKKTHRRSSFVRH